MSLEQLMPSLSHGPVPPSEVKLLSTDGKKHLSPPRIQAVQVSTKITPSLPAQLFAGTVHSWPRRVQNDKYDSLSYTAERVRGENIDRKATSPCTTAMYGLKGRSSYSNRSSNACFTVGMQHEAKPLENLSLSESRLSGVSIT